LLKYLDDDGLIVEPEYYLPIIPMVLVNGCSGKGTGWTTDIPQYNPRDIVKALKAKIINGTDFPDLIPFWKGWTGTLEQNGGTYISRGKFNIDKAKDIIEITELPVKKWTCDYKLIIEKLIEEGEDKSAVEDMLEYHTTRNVHFKLKLGDYMGNKLANSGQAEEIFKITGSFSVKNLVGWDSNVAIKRYENVQEIMGYYYHIRLQYYGLRKDYLISVLERDRIMLSEIIRFVMCVINGDIMVINVERAEVFAKLVELKFVMLRDMPQIKSSKVDEDAEGEVGEGGEGEVREFDYLFTLDISSLNFEKVEKSKAELVAKETQLTILQAKTLEALWLSDLDQFMEKLDQVEEMQKKEWAQPDPLEEIVTEKSETALLRESANKSSNNGYSPINRLLRKNSEIIGAISTDRNGPQSVPIFIDDYETKKRVKTNTPKVRSKSYMRFNYDWHSDN
jgi:DNA topoisomerase-2